MAITRPDNFKTVPLEIVGSSKFGRYAKINSERTTNLFISDGFLVDYPAYKPAIEYLSFHGGAKEGRGLLFSTKLNCLIAVMDDRVYLVTIVFDSYYEIIESYQVYPIGIISSTTGVVYITETNVPQIVISDNHQIYVYDPNPYWGLNNLPSFYVAQALDPANSNAVIPINFVPGYITFHDGYVIAAASNDQVNGAPGLNNTWRLGRQYSATPTTVPTQLYFTADKFNVSFLQSKPDNTQAVVRFPSKGNLIFVMGEITTEAWTDTGNAIFPYTRLNQYNIDYGCVSAATVAYMGELVIWLGFNEKSGPIILKSNGGMPERITTDGIDFLFSRLTTPQDSQAFIYQQDGHTFYHINFYTDNLSLYYDVDHDKFYNAVDSFYNYYPASVVAYYGNEYYFITKNNGTLFAMDSTITTYTEQDQNGNYILHEVPRMRTTQNFRQASQEYTVINDVGFTIETGETGYNQQDTGPLLWQTQNQILVITQGSATYWISQDVIFIKAQNGNDIIFQFLSPVGDNILFQQEGTTGTGFLSVPRVDFCVSRDGGASFGTVIPYYLNPIGQRKNKLQWWVGGISNDAVLQFRFWSLGRTVVTNGEVNFRK